MKQICAPVIALRLSNNAVGNYFMSLHTGKRLYSCIWKEPPITDDVIDRVKQLAIQEN